MNNTITAATIKRRGMAAIEEALRLGPVHILKHSKLAAVVISADEYQRLCGGQNVGVPGLTALQSLLNLPATVKRSKDDIDNHLTTERNW